jgi:hypothetical protein
MSQVQTGTVSTKFPALPRPPAVVTLALATLRTAEDERVIVEETLRDVVLWHAPVSRTGRPGRQQGSLSGYGAGRLVSG